MTEKWMLQPQVPEEGRALSPRNPRMSERQRPWRLLAALLAMAAVCYYGCLLARVLLVRGRAVR